MLDVNQKTHKGFEFLATVKSIAYIPEEHLRGTYAVEIRIALTRLYKLKLYLMNGPHNPGQEL